MHDSQRNKIIKRSASLIWNLLVKGHYDYTFDLMPFQFRNIPFTKRINLLKSGLNLFHRKLKPFNWPLNIQIELTNYCNLNCPICPIGAKTLERKPISMSLSLFEQLMNELNPYLITAALFAWGEPLLHPKIRDFLKIADSYRVATIISTNGQNLNDEHIINALLDYPPTYLIVALDGLSDEINSVYRKGAKIKPLLEGVRKISKLKKLRGQKLPILHMRYIVMKHNEHEVPKVKEFAEQNHFEFLTIRSLSTIETQVKTHKTMIPGHDRYRAAGHQERATIQHDRFTCDYPFVFPTILADGSVVACDQDYNGKHPLGTVTKTHSFSDVWFGRHAAEIRRTTRDYSEEFSFCQDCPYRKSTTGACSLEVQYESLYFNAPVC